MASEACSQHKHGGDADLVMLNTCLSVVALFCMQDAMRLYSSAIDKCDQVLEIKPRDTAVLVTFGLALKDMALCMTLDDPDVQLHLAVSTYRHPPCGLVSCNQIVSI